ncbi:MAG: hypothetical protein HY064_08570 [Bacteroidetes bacterium]|nr:hypothetical protein [Bacteroidota bacterium]
MKNFFSHISSFRRGPELLLVFIVIFSFRYSSQQIWKPFHAQQVISGDAIGYYSYLPATFIYHDLRFDFINALQEKYPPLVHTGECGFCNLFDGKPVNKYFAGEALLAAPFFLCGHAYAKMSGDAADGYSAPYRVAMEAAALFYFLLGTFFLLRYLRRTGINEISISISIALVFFGTNLFEYVLWEPAMTHVYSYSMFCIFIYLAHSAINNFTPKKFIFLSLITGLIIAIRPVNALIILSLPFLAENLSALKIFAVNILHLKAKLIYPLLTFASALIPQLLYYHAQSGRWFVYAYSKEGFDFLHPHFFQCLFSFNNGAFIYSPLLLICFIGIIPLFLKNKFRFFSFLSFFIAAVWVISSWWAWNYSGAFGMRPLVEFTPFFVILFCIFLSSIGTIFRILLSFIFILPLSCLLIFQVWQYHRGMFAWGGMTEKDYYRVFLRSEIQYMWLANDPPVLPIPSNAKIYSVKKFNLEQDDPFIAGKNILKQSSFSGNHSVLMDSITDRSFACRGYIDRLIPDSITGYESLLLDIDFKCRMNNIGTDASAVYSFRHNDKELSGGSYFIIRQMTEENKWQDVHLIVPLPSMMKGDIFSVMFNQTEKNAETSIDDVKLTVFR